ncbi:MAG TPA: nucleoside triphosphate pyrophosphohydrolase [Candidatus Binatus sp.]|uniref:nucleoside triphosphate pyrophosphohydrolase n=1 Tax=Candidatus Binatus sp. TaxID=2811406 RepID=UPI002B49F8A4|nr:nucleoside triphosphate pyrophosphohydrolase [Candidatus Binatus sp.]HKN12947.1 nucleoside triphosphate pyrophosphohydrolase [Candidatus Binatus sp.]
MSNDLNAAQAFVKLLAVVTELRARCPWDREQKLADTPPHLIEEVYEVADAIAHGNLPHAAEELGDVIAQCVFAGVILAENSEFDIATVVRNATEKLIRRHPHIYGDTHADTVERVLENWEKIKQQERESKNAESATSLAHVGRGLPAMMRAEKLGENARRTGMDWANIREVLAKAREELDEVEQALDRNDTAHAAEELGDLMLAIANAPRFIGKDAEQTLRAACDKFVARFDEVARIAASRGLDLKAMTPSEIDGLWNEAKAAARAAGRQ